MKGGSLTANDLDKGVASLMGRLDLGPIMDSLSLVGSGQMLEVLDQSGRANRYYQWLCCLMQYLKPKQVVELGAAAGISTLLMAEFLPETSKLISVDCDPQAWRWMKKEYNNVMKILGDDLDLKIYPSYIDLAKTDVWFIDSLHEEAQLRKELELYTPFFKPGAVVVFDDIHLNEGMNKVWEELPWNKHDITNPCHYSGFGVCVI